MRKVIKEFNVYKYEELSKEGKQKALYNYADINTDYDWYEYIGEEIKELGLKLVSFDLYRREIDIRLVEDIETVIDKIIREHGEHCETYKTAVSFMNDWQPVFSSYMDETDENYESRESEEILLEIEDEFKKSVLEDYRIMLSNEYDYLAGKEAIIETIKEIGRAHV